VTTTANSRKKGWLPTTTNYFKILYELRLDFDIHLHEHIMINLRPNTMSTFPLGSLSDNRRYNCSIWKSSSNWHTMPCAATSQHNKLPNSPYWLMLMQQQNFQSQNFCILFAFTVKLMQILFWNFLILK